MKWLMLSIALIASTPAYADGFTAMGAGSGASCGKWLSAREKKDFYALSNWALGFLSGAGWKGNGDALAGTDNDGVFYWLDNYCRANPTNNFIQALMAFYRDQTKTP